jgi:hypothetical protein
MRRLLDFGRILRAPARAHNRSRRISFPRRSSPHQSAFDAAHRNVITPRWGAIGSKKERPVCSAGAEDSE